jgi:hypothetical protein
LSVYGSEVGDALQEGTQIAIFSSNKTPIAHTMPSKCLLLAIVLPVLTLSALGQSAPQRHAVTKDEAIYMVMRLPEVRASKAYMLTHGKDRRKLFPMIYREPTKEKPYWWVAVGEDNGMSFVTHYGFLVYIKSGKLFYVDTLNGTHIDLDTWRKNGRKR